MAKLSEKEIETKIIELGKTGKTSEKIGLELKKEEIKPSDYKKRISQILRENSMYKNPDQESLKLRIATLEKHASKHKQDRTFKRALSKAAAKLRKIEN